MDYISNMGLIFRMIMCLYMKILNLDLFLIVSLN